jgi:uncharacterized protein YodC (DUF2158 family)
VNNFKVGDVVVLKSGGPRMIITDARDDNQGRDIYHCVFFSEDRANHGSLELPGACLQAPAYASNKEPSTLTEIINKLGSYIVICDEHAVRCCYAEDSTGDEIRWEEARDLLVKCVEELKMRDYEGQYAGPLPD